MIQAKKYNFARLGLGADMLTDSKFKKNLGELTVEKLKDILVDPCKS